MSDRKNTCFLNESRKQVFFSSLQYESKKQKTAGKPAVYGKETT
jgi:hypothetical protein